ncbi:MAG: type II toxin-antitoxin system VapC family toxin [Candidatus Micrarchaeota archaeon]|nr:type II toxin-antitoxin system VapC family toxin [Candidatus Micrarchaeota archaeon]
MAILDTNILIDYLHGRDKTGWMVERLSESGEIAITSINKYELLKKFPREPKLASLLDQMKIYPFDDAASSKAAELWQELRKVGKSIDEMDLLIAAIALANDEILFTEDKAFGNIDSGKISVVK